eukprot:4269245-Alexandrium_andersonii.AAC.1
MLVQGTARSNKHACARHRALSHAVALVSGMRAFARHVRMSSPCHESKTRRQGMRGIIRGAGGLGMTSEWQSFQDFDALRP